MTLEYSRAINNHIKSSIALSSLQLPTKSFAKVIMDVFDQARGQPLAIESTSTGGLEFYIGDMDFYLSDGFKSFLNSLADNLDIDLVMKIDFFPYDLWLDNNQRFPDIKTPIVQSSVHFTMTNDVDPDQNKAA